MRRRDADYRRICCQCVLFKGGNRHAGISAAIKGNALQQNATASGCQFEIELTVFFTILLKNRQLNLFLFFNLGLRLTENGEIA